MAVFHNHVLGLDPIVGGLHASDDRHERGVVRRLHRLVQLTQGLAVRPFADDRLAAVEGAKQFTRAFAIADQCPTNCSFVSGDASFAFATIAFAVLASRRRRQFVAAALGFGLAVGAMRMSTGSHFLSDIVFAGVFTILIVLLLERVMLARRRPDGPRPDGPRPDG